MRCYICDYTPEHGSDYANLAPHSTKLHTTPLGDFLCEECLNESDENFLDLSMEDDVEDSTD